MLKGLLVCLLLACQLSLVAGGGFPTLQLNCRSLLFHRAQSEEDGVIRTSSVVGRIWYSKANGELVPREGENPFEYEGLFVFKGTPQFSILIFDLEIPRPDSNANGLADVLEFTPGVTNSTAGEYFFLDGEGGTFTCNWVKPAESHKGVCEITFDNGVSFTHAFELFEFVGDWTGRVASDGAFRCNLTRSGVPAETATGVIKFSVTNETLIARSYGLERADGAYFGWESRPTLSLQGAFLHGPLIVYDGTPSATYDEENENDYNHWTVTLGNLADSDGDQVPDVVDNPPAIPPQSPRIEIASIGSQIRLRIYGEMGVWYRLQSASSMNAAGWEQFDLFEIEDEYKELIIEPRAGQGALFLRGVVEPPVN